VIRAELSLPYRAVALYPGAAVSVTNRCNLSCPHCFVYRQWNPRRGPPSKGAEMSDAVMLATLVGLRERHKIRSVLWTGGEPLLRWRLLARAVRLFPSNTIATNGTVRLADFGPGVLYVVSLDGPEDVNDAMRGAGVYASVMWNLSRIPDDFSSPIEVQCTVTRYNQGRLADLVEALRATRVSSMTFSFYVPRRGERIGHAWADNDERGVAVREVLRLKERHPDFIQNSRRGLELMLPPHAKQVTAACPARARILPLAMDGDHFSTPLCSYGKDPDCERCGAWLVFDLAACQPDAQAASA
jgi:MoaA/NifB/PqqE/SkfB family radical SAM enzyme